MDLWSKVKSYFVSPTQSAVDSVVDSTGTAGFASTDGATQSLDAQPESPGMTLTGGKRHRKTRKGKGKKHRKTRKH